MLIRNVDEINVDYIKVINALNELYMEAPSTTQEAVNAASEALKVNNEYTYTDEEIDNFLPPTLRGKIVNKVYYG